MLSTIVLSSCHEKPVAGRLAAIVAGLCFTLPVYAAESSGGYTFLSVLMLVMLVAAVAALAWLMRRGTGVMPGATSSMRLVAVQHLGPRERVVVLSVGSRYFLLGHTAQKVSMLTELSAEDFPPPVSRVPENMFTDLLKKLKR